MKKKVLVTGGAGFIGTNLCELLLLSGQYEIWSLDNYFTGKKSNHLSGIKYIFGNTENIFELVKFSPDYVYHLGEYSRVEQSIFEVEKVFNYNKIGTFKVVEFCRRNGSKLIYAGSSTKFGDGGLARDDSPYGWTKASNTELVNNYGKWYNLNYAIVYFYNAYGNREISSGKYSTLVAIFTEKMKKNLPLPVVLPGTQKRNFTHVSDIVSGLLLVGENGYGDEYGIGSPESFSVLEVAEKFGGQIEKLAPRQGNRMDAEVITNKTKALGWEPSISIMDYIDKLKSKKWVSKGNEEWIIRK